MKTINFEYRPLPIHAEFHTSLAYERSLFGAFGSGKTFAVVAEAIAWCLEQPGIRGMIARKTVPELRDTTETVFFEVLPPDLMAAGTIRRTGGHVERFIFPNGSVVMFRSIDDWNKQRSQNLGFLVLDEADEFDEETYQGMLSRVRQKTPTPEGLRYGATTIRRRGVWCASNPGGHNWLWRRFIENRGKLRRLAYTTSTSFDNPHLPPGYIDSLLQYPDPWIRRYVLCQFDDFAGQIYESWGWDTHVVDPPVVSRENTYWMGMDPGTRNPTAGLWVVVNADRSVTGVAEYEEPGRSVHQHAESWRMIEARLAPNVGRRIADPSIRTKDRGSNMGLDTQYSRLGFHFQLGPRDHSARIPALGQMIEMGRFKLSKNCPKTFEAIKDYRWAELTPQQKQKKVDASEKPVKFNDHLVDCSQYIASSHVPPMKKQAEKSRGPDADIYEEMRRKIDRDRRSREARGTLGVVV